MFLRRILIFVALCGMSICILLLLNVTAPNPTGRRYSSVPAVIDGSAQQKGDSGEEVLANDLKVPNNNDTSQRNCVCNSDFEHSRPPGDCRVCLAYSSEVSHYRRPDFFSEGQFIAEAKNVRALSTTNTRDYEQIQAFATGAKLVGVPLWLYVRVNSQLDATFYALVQSTGGAIVPYFTFDGYVDPVDEFAKIGIVVFLWVLAGCWLLPKLWSTLPRRRAPASRADLVTKTRLKIDDADDLVNRIRDRYSE